MPTTSGPILTLEAAALWGSGDYTFYTGSGGPQPFDAFSSAFAGVVDSADIATTPFNATAHNVDAGDQVTFALVVQNFANTASAYGITLRAGIPPGFDVPSNFGQITVTDGAGNPLDFGGNLFDAYSGMTLGAPLAPYSDTSGANVAIITFTLQASGTLIEPAATITEGATIASYAASPGGPNLAPSAAPSSLSAGASIVTGQITVGSAADQPSAPLASGQTDSFDITITLPEGITQNLAIAEQLIGSGGAALRLVSVQLVSQGANITTTLPAVMQPDGSIQLGRVVNAPDNLETAADQLVVRVTVANGGTAAGATTLKTTVSAADPNTANANWSTSLTNAITLAAPDTPPTIAGISAGQHTTSTLPVSPFANIVFTDPDPGQTQTLTINLSDGTLGTLSGAAGLTQSAANSYTLTGSVTAVQAAARALLFTPAAGASGTETFGLTLNDGASGVASNSATTLVVAPSAGPSALATYPLSPQTVLTSTPTGTTTYAQVQSYGGPIDNVQSQFLYDGAAPIAIVARQSGMLISSTASATAVQLLGGNNTVEMAAGSGFLTSGTGNDNFLLHADQAQPTWDTLVNFHAGDTVTIYGVHAWSARSSAANQGAAGYTGATMHFDVNADGTTDSSITFAGRTLTDLAHFTTLAGNAGGMDFLQLTA